MPPTPCRASLARQANCYAIRPPEALRAPYKPVDKSFPNPTRPTLQPLSRRRKPNPVTLPLSTLSPPLNLSEIFPPSGSYLNWKILLPAGQARYRGGASGSKCTAAMALSRVFKAARQDCSVGAAPGDPRSRRRRRALLRRSASSSSPCSVPARRSFLISAAGKCRPWSTAHSAPVRVLPDGRPAAYETSGRRSRRACASVPASTYSSSPPTGTPRAMRETLTPRLLSISER